MAQFGRPSSDITNNTWTTLPTGGQSLFEQVNETPYSDTDYVRATGNGQTMEVKLSSVTDPISAINHILRLRAKATGSSSAEKWTVTLYQGATLIATAFNATNVTRTSFNNYVYTLTTAQANAITDYSDLRVRIVVTQAAGETIDVSFIEFEVPSIDVLTANNINAGTPVLGNPVLDGPMDPTFFPGLVAWHKADAIIGLNDGDQITNWIDSSGNNCNVDQVNTQPYPHYKVNIKNSLPVTRWVGANSEVLGQQIGHSNPLTLGWKNVGYAAIFVVFKPTSATAKGDVAFVEDGTNGVGRVGFAVSETGYPGEFTLFSRRLDGDTVQFVHGGTVIANNWFIVAILVEWANHIGRVYVNGEKVAENLNFLTAGNTSDTESWTVDIASSGGASFMDGDVAEVVWYNQQITETQAITLSNDYLNAKWNVYTSADNLTANNINAGIPVLGTSTLGQKHVLSANNINTGIPVLGTSTLGQKHVLSANNINAGTPILGNPVLSIIVNLLANNINAGTPVLGTSTLGQKHVLSANNINTGIPVLGTSTLGQKHVLSANNINAGVPTLGAAILGQKHVLSANNINAGVPILGNPTLTENAPGQDNLVANNINAGVPVLDTSILGQKHVLSANNINAGVPTLGTSTLGQKHVLSANNINTGAPVLGTPSLGQKHVLSANNITSGVPVLGNPTLIENAPDQDNLVANDINAGIPILGTPSLGQKHVLSANNINAGVPILGLPNLGQKHVLSANSIVTGIPVLGVSTLTQKHVLHSNNIIAGIPVLGTSILGQKHVLSANNITSGIPVLGKPTLTENVDNLIANGIVTGVPICSRPTITQIHQLIADELDSGIPILGNPELHSYLYKIDTLIISESQDWGESLNESQDWSLNMVESKD